MRFASLGSGSEGNGLVVESGGTRVLIDCGFGVRGAATRLGRLGLAPSSITAILVTHEHSDHIGGVPAFAARHGIPVWATFGTLADIVEKVEALNDRRPGIFLLGRAVGLREHLRWFDAKPLFGKRVLVTRPREQAGEMSELIESLGGEAIEAPFIRIVPPHDYDELDAAVAAIGEYDWLVFSSANAVEAFMQRLLASPLDMRALAKTKLCAVGPATSERLAKYGLKVDLTPAEYRAESIVEAFATSANVQGLSVLIPRADIGREIVGDELRRQGAEVTEVVAYRTVVVDPEREGEPDVYRMLLDKQLDVVTFASASSVRSFVRAFGQDQAADLLRPVAVAAIGPVTAQVATQYGIHTTIMPAHYTVPALVDAIVQHVRGRRT